VDPNHIGDMLISSPVYKALKSNLPDAQVDAFIYPFARVALAGNPFVDTMHDLPRGSLLKQLKAAFRLRRKKYDLVLQVNTSLRTNLLMWIIGRRYRLGYDFAHRGCLNNVRVPIETRTARTRYRLDESLDLLEKAFGWNITDRKMVFNVTDENRKRIAELFRQNGIPEGQMLIGLHPHFRRTWEGEPEWEPEKFARLVNLLLKQYHAAIIITGVSDDVEYIRRIIAAVDEPGRVVNLAEQLSFQEMGALLLRVKVFITVNTGPMHIAIAQNVPTVALMRATPAFITFPLNNPIFQYLEGKREKTYTPFDLSYEKDSSIQKIEVSDVLAIVESLFKII
jgi:ADP-heptose:LPS heptosyltransferase